MTTEPERKGVFIGRRTLVALSALFMIAVIIVGWQLYVLVGNQQTRNVYSNLQPMQLALVALNGTQRILDASEIAKLASTSARAGFVTSTGRIVGPNNYTGVALTTLCDLVGGLTENNSLRVTADDGYSMVYAYAQVKGNFPTFDPETGLGVNHTQPLTTVLAYFRDGQNLTSDEGPLRLAIVGSEVLLTEGHFWIKFVVKIEICSSVRDWTLVLKGVIVENMTRATFESGANFGCHGTNWTDSEDNTWSGIPLWRLVGRVDDNDPHEGAAFNRTLVAIGYTVKVITGEGYSREFNSTFVAMNDNIIVANKVNEAVLDETYWPLKLVGSAVASSDRLRNIVEIQIIFPGS